jgi:aspartate racemase
MPVMQSEGLPQRYRERFGIEIVVPTDRDKEVVDRIIFDELVRRDLRDDSKREYLRIIEALQAQGAQGVILGCTEIFLLIDQDNLPDVPVFDTTELHVEATVAFALADAARDA